MNNSKRFVSLFMTVGLVLAVMVGIAVWKLSSPKSSSDASYQADAVEATVNEAASDTQVAETTGEAVPPKDADDSSNESSEGTRSPSAEQTRDPLLPPHAVFGTTPRTTKPTEVFRPSNVVPTSVAPQVAEPGSQTQQGGSNDGSEMDRPTASPTTAPETTSVQPTPSTPTSAVPTEPQGGETDSTSAQPTAAQEQSDETTIDIPGSQQPEASVRPDTPTSAAAQTTATPEAVQRTETAVMEQATDSAPWWDRVRGFFN